MALSSLRPFLGRVIPPRLRGRIKNAEIALQHLGVRLPHGQNCVLDAIASVHRQLESDSTTEPASRDEVGTACARYERHRQTDVPSEYQVGALWKAELARERHLYSTALENRDTATLARLLPCFHRNDAGAGVDFTINHMREVFGDSFRALCFTSHLIAKHQALARFATPDLLRLSQESEVGNPILVPYEQRGLTLNGLRHAIYALEIGQLVDLKRPDHLFIVEIGAGYGNLARILTSLRSCRAVTYIIVDIPPMLPLVTYFLSHAVPGARIGLDDDLPVDSSLEADTLSRFSHVILPNWDIRRLATGLADVVINTASLAEMEEGTVNTYLGHVQRLIRTGGVFFTVNRRVGRSSEGAKEVGMDAWDLGWPGFSRESERDSWADRHAGAWEDMDYQQLALRNNLQSSNDEPWARVPLTNGGRINSEKRT